MQTLPPLDLTRDVLCRLAQIAQTAGDTPNANALNKADHQAASGVYEAIRVAFDGSLLVPSRSTADVVYRVSEIGCSCTAGANGRPCWHAALAEAIRVAYDEYVEACEAAAGLEVAITPGAAAAIAEIAAGAMDDAEYARIVAESEEARARFAARERAEREIAELFPDY